ncbi:MAG: FixH family protein [Thiobacillus sp.]|nr:FixH family protein [Thiobacillus sp.]
MNTFASLFGGLAAVLVLYAAGGLLRGLPPMLRAALAGLIPLVAYFALIVGRWPGLDVAAIHISVFLAAALVLYAISQFQRRGTRLHWVPKLLIAFFVGLVFLNAGFLYVATSGLPVSLGNWWLGGNGRQVHSGFSGVVPHGEGAARAVSSELSETHRESRLGWQVETEGFEADAPVRPVVVRVRNRTGLPVAGVVAELQVSRPGAPETVRSEPLRMTAPGVYQGELRLPASGRWLVDLRLSREGALQYHSSREVTVP